MFPLLNDVCARVNIEAHKNLFIEHLDGLLMHFSHLFQRSWFYKVSVDTESICRWTRWWVWTELLKKKNW